MGDRAFNGDFVGVFRLRDRKTFLDWTVDTYGAGKGMRTGTYAAIAAGRSAPEESIAKVVGYLLDIEYKGNLEAARFLTYMDDAGIAPSQRQVSQLVTLLSHPTEPQNPFLNGGNAIRDLFHLARDPARCVRPCANESEVVEATRWLYVDGGRRMARKRITEADAIKEGERFVRTSLADYAARLVDWWRAVPWSVAVGGDNLSSPIVMSVTAPLSNARYDSLRAGQLDMLRAPLELGLQASANLFFETFAQSPLPRRAWTLTPPLFHMLRTVLCQQAVLSDVPGLADTLPLRIISLGCAEEYCRWLRRFKYEPLGVQTPHTKLDLWGRDFWTEDQMYQFSPQLGVWKVLQRRFRQAETTPRQSSG